MSGSKEERTKTVALLCTALHALGGTNIDMLNIYRNINGERFRGMIVYCSRQKNLLEQFFLEEGVKKTDLFYFPLSKKLLFIPLVFRLQRLFREEKVDILHTFFLHSDIIGFFSAFLARIRCLVSSVHGKFLWDEINGVCKEKQSYYKFLNSLIRNHFYKTITVSRELAQEVQSYHVVENSKIITIPVGVNIPSDEEIQINKDVSLHRKTIIIGTVCRLTKDKGLHYLIGAALQVIDKIDLVKFIIVGKGPQEKELKQLVAKEGVESKIIFPGRVENIANFFKSIDIFAMTSVREGCPIALLESLSFGKPAVAFAAAGLNEIIIDGENGVLVEPFNVKAFADALLHLCSNHDYAKKLGMNGRKYVQEKYSVDEEIRKIEQVYFDGLSVIEAKSVGLLR